MRYMIKGGVWKNSEDEILKAAVMKYGLNQWSRISSLLVRKSAKQCKQRWYEWLDPSIRKTEWTREEEEKLLHLAKIFPCQWRTIAPIVGRTPAQCVEHYERLLDKAQGKEEMDENDPRRLKPGEIDPTPETKPAKPDPVDMDEDEKEMLAEARVRLANTQGKKAKRKAREKQIEEARRLANIQKQRELRAAGIELVSKKKPRGMNYNEEVPFERVPLEIAFKTGKEENPKPNLHLANISLQTLEGGRRDEEEEQKRKLDQKKIKKLKERDLPLAISKFTQPQKIMNEAKTKLTMPSPNITDKELEDLGKLNASQAQQFFESNQATNTLVGNYSQRDVTPTPMRTPRVQTKDIMREAQNTIALLQTETPLMGGQNAPLNNPDFSGITPRTKPTATPGGLGSFATPRPRMDTFATPRNAWESVRQTPLHDQLKLNEDMLDRNWETTSQSAMSVTTHTSATADKMRAKMIREQIKTSLSALPKAKNDYQIELPDIETLDADQETRVKALDQEEIERLEREKEEKRQKEAEQQISTAIQKKLPRPFKINAEFQETGVTAKDESITEAETMISQEMNLLLNRDATLHPFKGCEGGLSVEYDTFENFEIEGAAKLIEDEITELRNERGHGKFREEDYEEAWDARARKIDYDPITRGYIDFDSSTMQEKIVYRQNCVKYKRDNYSKEVRKLETIENKAKVILGGYDKTINKLETQLQDCYVKSDQYRTEYEVFNYLYNQEKKLINYRVDEMQRFYNSLVDKENRLQRRYASLKEDLEETMETEPVPNQNNATLVQ